MAKRETCKNCLRPISVCYCHAVKKVETQSQILILRHFKEKDHPFNTARMAELSLQSCNILDSDNPNFEQEIIDFIQENNPFLLFFTPNSKRLDEKIEELPSKNFIALDGTWDKARKILFTTGALKELPIYHLSKENETIYAPIRKACADGFISTIEAIGETLRLVQPDETHDGLLSPLEFTVNKQLEIRKTKK